MGQVNCKFYTKSMSEPARVQKETDRVTKWVISLGRQDSSQRVHKAFTVFRQILDLAVMGERLINSPARRAKQLGGKGFLAKIVKIDKRLRLTSDQVIDLGDAAGPYRLKILVMALTVASRRSRLVSCAPQL
jgi:hypothetical protein